VVTEQQLRAIATEAHVCMSDVRDYVAGLAPVFTEYNQRIEDAAKRLGLVITRGAINART
jgi:hypothetical protein